MVKFAFYAFNQGDDPLICDLAYTHMANPQSYEALSYVGAPLEPPYYLECEGCNVRVTESLHDAIHRFRHSDS